MPGGANSSSCPVEGEIIVALYRTREQANSLHEFFTQLFISLTVSQLVLGWQQFSWANKFRSTGSCIP